MRICFVSAGTFAHVGSYLDFFREAGHEVHFVALSPSPPRSVPTHEVGIGGRRSAPPERWRYPLSMLRARQVVKRLKPDILHAHYATSGGLASLVCGFRPTIVTAHGTDLTRGIQSPVWRPLLKAVFARAACVNTVSSELTRMAVSLGVGRNKVAELTLGVDTSRFSSPARPELRAGEPLRLICTRQFEEVYDHRTIVEALAILRTKKVEFKMTFAGGGSLRREIEALAERRGLGASAVFLGEVGGEEMPAMLGNHDVYLSASRADGTSLSLLEAMSSGLFPIVARIRANEAWLEREAGFLHGIGDPEELAARVLELARRPELTAAAAARNRAKVVAEGDRTTNMRKLEKIYEELIAGLRPLLQ